MKRVTGTRQVCGFETESLRIGNYILRPDEIRMFVRILSSSEPTEPLVDVFGQISYTTMCEVLFGEEAYVAYCLWQRDAVAAMRAELEAAAE